jgi:hypothetical protein
MKDALEMAVLTTVSHPNIIQVRGRGRRERHTGRASGGTGWRPRRGRVARSRVQLRCRSSSSRLRSCVWVCRHQSRTHLRRACSVTQVYHCFTDMVEDAGVSRGCTPTATPAVTAQPGTHARRGRP